MSASTDTADKLSRDQIIDKLNAWADALARLGKNGEDDVAAVVDLMAEDSKIVSSASAAPFTGRDAIAAGLKPIAALVKAMQIHKSNYVVGVNAGAVTMHIAYGLRNGSYSQAIVTAYIEIDPSSGKITQVRDLFDFKAVMRALTGADVPLPDGAVPVEKLDELVQRDLEAFRQFAAPDTNYKHFAKDAKSFTSLGHKFADAAGWSSFMGGFAAVTDDVAVEMAGQPLYGVNQVTYRWLCAGKGKGNDNLVTMRGTFHLVVDPKTLEVVEFADVIDHDDFGLMMSRLSAPASTD